MTMDHFLQDEINSLSPASADGASRRGFLKGSVAAGFAAAVAPTGDLLAQVITTDAKGLMTGMVDIPSRDRKIPAYHAMPEGKTKRGVVIVVHEIFGVHEYIQDTCRRFARLGYLAIAPDFFVRHGDVRSYKTVAEIFSNVVSKVPDTEVLADIDATLAWASTHGGDATKVGITGFCWGGRIVWMASAANPRLKAGVAWYGRLMTMVNAATPTHPHDIAEKLQWPVLGLYGGKDDGIPMDTVEEMKTRLSFGGKASQASEFVIYPEAPHAFHADYRPSYRKEAAEDGFKRAVAWFKKHGVA
ncbi:MAG: dienelactone hydrolase family protein [Burkholderiaceae bacterium]